MRKSKKILVGFVLALTMHSSFAANEWRILSAILRIFSGAADIAAIVEETDNHVSFNQTTFDRNQIAFHKNRFQRMIDLVGNNNRFSINRFDAVALEERIRADARSRQVYSDQFTYVRKRVDDAIGELNRIRNRHSALEGYPFDYSLSDFISDMYRLSNFIRNSHCYHQENFWFW